MTPTPPLSLILSTLDEGTGLYETVRSVFAGSLTPAETIIVDDGGTDHSCKILEQSEWHARNVVVHHIRRSGVAGARNAGAALATTPYRVFLDAHCRLQRDLHPHCPLRLPGRPEPLMLGV